jgi:hypothetical protein
MDRADIDEMFETPSQRLVICLPLLDLAALHGLFSSVDHLAAQPECELRPPHERLARRLTRRRALIEGAVAHPQQESHVDVGDRVPQREGERFTHETRSHTNLPSPQPGAQEACDVR